MTASKFSLINAASQRRFRCPHGHEQVGEYRVNVHGPNGLAEFNSGPICRRCYWEKLVAGCETTLVPEES